MKLFLAPHNDDECLFGAFTLIRERPLVVIVTDAWNQFNRETGITAEMRWEETKKAMEILGCPVIRLGIRDDCLDEASVRDKLSRFVGFETVYAPAVQDGNLQHDLIGRIAGEVFGDKCKYYATYTKEQLYTTGIQEIIPTPDELILKEKVLLCYQSQINLPDTAPHFEAVRGHSEWYI
jgi:LmbE family N-acetylglucosaminyl deacetylase